MQLLDLLFPKRCLGCGRIGLYFCQKCRRTVENLGQADTICPMCERSAIDGATHPRCRREKGIDGLTSFFRYRGVVKKAIKSIKYRYVYDIASELLSLVPPTSYNFAREVGQLANTVLIPVPLHVAKLRSRGFNQAELVSKILSSKIKIPVANVAQRPLATIPQVDMPDRNSRLKNMARAFQVAPKSTKGITSAIIVDDVFTTGATLRSLATALKSAGVDYVWGVTIAR